MTLSRLPDRWHESGPGIAIPVMAWQVEWPPDHSPATCEHARSFISVYLGRSSSSGGTTFLSEFAALLAVYLQCAGNAFLEDWVFVPEGSCAGDRISYSFVDEHIAAMCGNTAHAIVSALMSSEYSSADYFCAAAHKPIRKAWHEISLKSPREGMLRHIVEARRRGIPVTRLSTRIALFRFGYGHRQQRLWKGFTSSTSYLGATIAFRKELTSELLRRHGLPVPEQYLVRDVDAALEAAALIGYPVVVKPAGTERGTAVSTGLMDTAAVASAFDVARPHGDVVVEQHIEGDEHRFTIVDGRCIGVGRRDPPRITGNGVDTVASLIADVARQRKEDPFHRIYKAASLEDPFVQETLRRQNVSPETVPARGSTVLLRTNSNLATGGVLSEVWPATHPDNIRLAERAAAIVGLDYAGVDFLTRDISQSWRSFGGGICEVNPSPGLVATDAVMRVLDYLFQDGSNGRIPLVLVVADQSEAGPVLDAVAQFAKANAATLGSVIGGEARVGGFPVCAGELSIRDLTRFVLFDPETEIAMIQVTPEDLLSDGIDAFYCDMAILLVDDVTVRRILDSPLSVAAKSEQILVRPAVEQVTAGLRHCTNAAQATA